MLDLEERNFYDEEIDAAKDVEENLLCGKWETRNGKIISISKMKKSHIRNCIWAIKRKKINLLGFEEDYIELFEAELERR